MTTPDTEQLQRWATDQLATVTTRGSAIAGNRPTVPPDPTPVVLASVTETRTWRTEGRPLGVSLQVPPDGRARLAVGELSGTVRIWDPETGDLLHSLTEHTGAVYSVDWGHDRDGVPLLAIQGDDVTVRIWNPESGELAYPDPIPARRTGLYGEVSWGYAPDGRPLLAIGASYGILIWDPETREAVRANAGDYALIYTVSWGFGHDGELLLAFAGSGPTVQIFNIDSGQVRQVHTGHTQAVRAVAWVRPDGESLRFVTVGMGSSPGVDDATLCLWREGPDGKFTAETADLRQGPLIMVSAVPLPDGRVLLAGHSDTSLFVLDGNSLELLHTQPVAIGGRGLHHLDWAVRPDGRLMVCATSDPDDVHVWNITLDPPIPLETSQRAGTLVIPPQDVTPRFQPVATTESVHCAVRADGEVIAATWHEDGQARIWAISTGSLLQTIALQRQPARRFAFGHLPDGQLVLATASTLGPDIQLWDPDTGLLVASRVHQPISRQRSGVASVAWTHDRDGRPLLASGGSDDHTVLVQDPESGVTVRTFGGHEHSIHAIADGRLADGRRRLVTGPWHAPARLWDPDSGELLLEFALSGSGEDANRMWTAAWGQSPDGRAVIAIGTHDGVVRIWDPETGEVMITLAGHDSPVDSLLWWDRPGWPSILVSAAYDQTVRIWDPAAGTELAQLRSGTRMIHSVDVASTRDGDLLLVAPAKDQQTGPLRVWRIATGPPGIGGANADPRASPAAELAELLLRLGDGGLWLPLGLLADLVTLTSPATEPAATGLSDARLAALGAEPGITRLRDLAADQPGWNQAARGAFAALLASTLDIPEHFTPPAEADQPGLRQALAEAAVPGSGARRWQVPVAGLREAATAITEQTVTLLRILGPGACAADPLLPLRLAHHAQRLPALTRHELQLLAPASQPAANGRTAAGTLVYSPGTVGVTRTGPLTRLLPTQLALPHDLLTVRLTENQLLYRQHRAPTPPAPEPVTIILDTTPPTFGPAGQVLRLVAHLITATLWKHGQHPTLITLTDPDTVTDLHAPADLLRIWTSATLDDPLPALATALQAAATAGHPVAFCTHQHTARASYAPGPATRLLTTHQPPEQPPPAPTSLWHVHLPPRPTREQLTAAITKLVMPHAEDRAFVP